MSDSDMVARAQEVADDIAGTCDNLEKHATEEERDNALFLAVLDDNVFCCTVCDWWCRVEEMAEDCGDDFICDECFDSG